MAISDSAGILFKIKGDPSDAVKAFNEVEKAGKGSTESLSSSFAKGTLAGNLMHDAISRITSEVLQLGPALFNLAKAASDYGSEIYDASIKTGLSTEALSALKYAADLSGSSFEQLTKGITSFGIEVGKAADGNDKAVAKMAALGVTSNDLHTALGQVIKTIFNAKNETDRLRLATEAFGKKVGPDLIPLIIDAEGNLEKLEKTAAELGITLSEESAKAADEFGDTLTLLETQAAATGRAFIGPLMKDITEAMKKISVELQKNQSSVKAWGEYTANVIRGLAGVINDLLDAYKRLVEWQGANKDNMLFLTGPAAILRYLEERGKTSRAQSTANNTVPATVNYSRPGDYKLPTQGDKELADAAKKAADDARKAREEAAKRDLAAQKEHVQLQLKDERADYAESYRILEKNFLDRQILEDEYITESERRLEIYSARAKKLLLDAFKLDAQGKTPAEIANLRLAKEQANEAIDREIGREREDREKNIANVLKKTTDAAEDAAEATEKLRKKYEELNEDQQKFHEQQQDRIREQIEDQRALGRAETERIQKREKEIDAETRARDRAKVEKGIGGYLGAGLSGLGAGLGTGSVSIFGPLDQIKTAGQMTEDVYTHMAGVAGEAIGSMVQGLTQLATTWLITGEFSAKAALSMLASIALQIATQAGFEAIMQVAKGIAETAAAAASLAIGDLRGAGLHTAAATAHYAAASAFGVVAAVAGGAGVGLALGARAAGGGSGAASNPSDLSQQQAQQDRSAISRYSSTAGTSGRTWEAQVVGQMLGLSQAVDGLNNKIGSMQPHEVMTRAENQRPGITASHAVNGIASNGGLGTRLQRVTGARR
jgi:hypothetical protein